MMKTISRKVKIMLTLCAVVAVATACAEGGTGSSDGTTGSVTGDTGIAGSTARMVIVDDFLYAIADNRIQLFSIAEPSMPNPWVRVSVDWDIQTLFPYEDYLLVGAADGIHILDNTDPASPFLIADLQHARTIDPVVASKGFAYVTLKNDPNAFNSVEDQMNVVSLADITNPELLRVIPMQSPEGLSTIDNRLFVCDGVAGLKQFDITQPDNPTFVDVISTVDCNDVIAFGGILYAITDTSVLQFDYSMSPPSILSRIETGAISQDALFDALSSQVTSY